MRFELVEGRLTHEACKSLVYSVVASCSARHIGHRVRVRVRVRCFIWVRVRVLCFIWVYVGLLVFLLCVLWLVVV